MQGLNNYMAPNGSLLPNYFQQPVLPQMQSLGLNQVEGFAPVESFTDESNCKWTLAKAASNSTVGIPDPKSLQIVDFWNHAFPRKDLSSKLYVYVVEGIKQPQVATEQPMKVLYQWFSPVFVPQFTPQMISDQEWKKANVYAAPVVDARISKLNALCKVQGAPAADTEPAGKLLQVEGLSDGSAGGN